MLTTYFNFAAPGNLYVLKTMDRIIKLMINETVRDESAQCMKTAE